MPGWMNHFLESTVPGEISTTSPEVIIPDIYFIYIYIISR